MKYAREPLFDLLEPLDMLRIGPAYPGILVDPGLGELPQDRRLAQRQNAVQLPQKARNQG